MKALILDNKVVDTSETEFEVHSSMTWMDCPAECKAGEWELVGGNLQAIPEPEDTRTYAEKRQAEYPPVELYLDGIVKGDTAQVDKYIADCLAVKDKYPKGGN